MTKNIVSISSFILVTAALVACNAGGNNPGLSYAPDMTYSKAYETYAPAQERLKNSEAAGATYTGMPVEGTVARGSMAAYTLKNDSLGYEQSKAVRNPMATADVDMKEAERLYLVNCAICHGAKLDGNGPLYKDGNGPYSAAPKDLLGAEMKAMPDGQMFHSVTYGKNMMGSYAAQLSTKQRWMVISYIKFKQGGGAVATDSSAAPATGTTVAADTAAAK